VKNWPLYLLLGSAAFSAGAACNNENLIFCRVGEPCPAANGGAGGAGAGGSAGRGGGAGALGLGGSVALGGSGGLGQGGLAGSGGAAGAGGAGVLDASPPDAAALDAGDAGADASAVTL
jgi:hypothetical protein